MLKLVKLSFCLAMVLMAACGVAQRTSRGITISRAFTSEPSHAAMRHVVAKIPLQDPLAEKLSEAVSKGNVAQVAELLEQGADPNANHPLLRLGGTPDQALAIARLLIAKGADVNYHHLHGWTPLMKAVGFCPGGLPLLKLLIEKGANLDVRTGSGETALHMAVLLGKSDIVDYLIKKGANLEAAIHRRGAGLPGNGAEPGYKEVGETPLFVAALTGSVAILDLLVRAGANLRATDASGWTLLHEAAKHGHRDALAYLLEKGLDPNQASINGDRPLHQAVGLGSWAIDCISLLVSHGADPKLKNKAGETPLDLYRRDAEQSLNTLTGLDKTPVGMAMIKSHNRQVRRAEKLLGAG